MDYHVIYDGNCNLCVSLVQQMEKIDKGKRFDYVPMQAEDVLASLKVTPEECELGMILIDANHPQRRWQGSDAAEEIARQFPLGDGLIELYQKLPGMKWIGDRIYEQTRDNRYQWFGRRSQTYRSPYPVGCTARKQEPKSCKLEERDSPIADN